MYPETLSANVTIVDGVGYPPKPTQAELDAIAISQWDGCSQVLQKVLTVNNTYIWPDVIIDEVAIPQVATNYA